MTAHRRNRVLIRGATVVVLIVAVLAGLRLMGWIAPAGPRPIVILIMADTLRADHVGFLGYEHDTTPNLDRFAADAMTFENCYSHAPETRSSCGSVLTGFLPHETRVPEFRQLPGMHETLAEILKSVGYQTAAVVSNYVLRKGYGFEQGFDVYDDTMDDFEAVRQSPERTAARTTDRAIELLRQRGDKPMFLWVFYQDPHGPYTPPGEFSKMFIDPDRKPRLLEVNDSISGRGAIPSYQRLGEHRDYHYYVSQYNGEIRYFDKHVGRLIEAIRKMGLYDDALIIFTSDHGEGMGERDYYFAHGENLYDYQLHVPLVIRHGRKFIGRRSDDVQHIDLLPTILRTLGLTPNPLYRGRDLRRPDPPGADIFALMNSWELHNEVQFSLIRDGLKMIYFPRENRYDLFDLRKQPRETRNLFADAIYQQRARELSARLAKTIADDRLQLRVVMRDVALTEEQKRNMQSLGYTK